MKTTGILSLAACLGLLSSGGMEASEASAAPAPAAKASAVKPYPNKTCIVSGSELGSMWPVVTKTHGDRQVKFCCKPCVRKFGKDPGRYLKKR